MDLAMSNGAFFTLNTDTQRERKLGRERKKITIICYFFHLKNCYISAVFSLVWKNFCFALIEMLKDISNRDGAAY